MFDKMIIKFSLIESEARKRKNRSLKKTKNIFLKNGNDIEFD